MSSSLSLDGGKGWGEGASAAKGDDDGNALSTALEKERIIRCGKPVRSGASHRGCQV